MTPEQKFQHKVDEELVHVRIKQVGETIFEVAEEGRRAATTKRALEEEGKVMFKLFLFKDVLKSLDNPFMWMNKNKDLNTTLSDESGEDKVWIRKVE